MRRSGFQVIDVESATIDRGFWNLSEFNSDLAGEDYLAGKLSNSTLRLNRCREDDESIRTWNADVTVTNGDELTGWEI